MVNLISDIVLGDIFGIAAGSYTFLLIMGGLRGKIKVSNRLG